MSSAAAAPSSACRWCISTCGDRGLCRAKGIIAIGNVATGFLAIGGFSARPAVHRRPGCRTADPGRTGRGDRRRGRTGRRSPACPGRRCVQPGAGTGGCAVSQSVAIGGAAVGQYAAGGAALGSTLAIGQDAQSSSGGLALTLDQLRAYGGNTEALFQMIHAQLPEAPEWVVRLLLCVCP